MSSGSEAIEPQGSTASVVVTSARREPAPTSRRLTLTVPEVAALLGIGRNEAYVAVQRGEIPARKVGRRILIPRAAFDRWLAEAPARRPR